MALRIGHAAPREVIAERTMAGVALQRCPCAGHRPVRCARTEGAVFGMVVEEEMARGKIEYSAEKSA